MMRIDTFKVLTSDTVYPNSSILSKYQLKRQFSWGVMMIHFYYLRKLLMFPS